MNKAHLLYYSGRIDTMYRMDEENIGKDAESLLFPNYTKHTAAKDGKDTTESVHVDTNETDATHTALSIDKTVIVIGAGIAGLAIACLLSKKGYTVRVLEKNDENFTKVSEKKVQGYPFTLEPPWVVFPEAFNHFFSLLDEKMSDYITLERVTPAFRAICKDTSINTDIRGDWIIDGKFFETLEPGAERAYENFIADVKSKYDRMWNTILFDTTENASKIGRLRAMFDSSVRTLYGKSQSYVQKFFKNDVIQKILQYQHVFMGGSPYITPAFLTVATNIERGGVFYPKGGVQEIYQGFKKLAQKYGVTITYKAPVRNILVEHAHAIGVTLESGEVISAQTVISNADMAYTELSLLPAESRTYGEQYWNEKILAPSVCVLYLGLRESVDAFPSHTILFPKDWRHTHEQLFERGQFPDDPYLYIYASPAKDALTIHVPISARMTYSKQTLDLFRQQILRVLAGDVGITNIESIIEIEAMYSSEDYKHDFNSYGGTANGLALTTSQSGDGRPESQSKKVSNLLYVGGYTKPGPGMAFEIISAVRAFKIMHSVFTPEPLDSIQI